MAEESPKGIDPKIHRFAESAQQGLSGLLCLTCGSTAVDQRSRSELACAACGTAVPWEGEKFAVLRYVVMTEGAIDDALEANLNSYSRRYASIVTFSPSNSRQRWRASAFGSLT